MVDVAAGLLGCWAAGWMRSLNVSVNGMGLGLNDPFVCIGMTSQRKRRALNENKGPEKRGVQPIIRTYHRYGTR